jgi:hypothetical protein
LYLAHIYLFKESLHPSRVSHILCLINFTRQINGRERARAVSAAEARGSFR